VKFDYRGIPVPDLKVTDEGLNARGGFAGVVYHPPPNATR